MQNDQSSTTSTNNSLHKPHMNKKQNAASFAKTNKHTGGTSDSQSRNAKRARWAKKNKPVAKPAVKRGPVKEYLCVCHNEPARKPAAGQKEVAKDPETGKMKDRAKGLGHWRCSVTGKTAKVSAGKPKTAEVPNATSAPPGA